MCVCVCVCVCHYECMCILLKIEKQKKKKEKQEKQHQKVTERETIRSHIQYSFRIQYILSNLGEAAKECFRSGSLGEVMNPPHTHTHTHTHTHAQTHTHTHTHLVYRVCYIWYCVYVYPPVVCVCVRMCVRAVWWCVFVCNVLIITPTTLHSSDILVVSTPTHTYTVTHRSPAHPN